ncbi:MAG: hypothetical protein JJU33_04500 [Phycisphaerales bacterium]|nr:hypothetical protein [Phycisphaerales bacterium]
MDRRRTRARTMSRPPLRLAAAAGVALALWMAPAEALAQSEDDGQPRTVTGRQGQETRDIQAAAEEAAEAREEFRDQATREELEALQGTRRGTIQEGQQGRQPARPGEAGARQPGDVAARSPQEIEAAIDEEGLIRFSAFTEGVDLLDLVNFVAETLQINVTVDPTLSGSVTFNASFAVRRSELLPLLNTLLEQQGFAITRDRIGFYQVTQVGQIRPKFADEDGLIATKMIPTRNLRPSAIDDAVRTILGDRPAKVSYLDQLGLILISSSPDDVATISELVERIVLEQTRLEWIRFELNNLAAPVARDRVVDLLGASAPQTLAVAPGQPQQAQQRQQQQQQRDTRAPARPTDGLENLVERLTIDPQGNALIFRGRADEAEQVQRVLAIVDQPSSLRPRRYFTGTATRDIARFAAQQGLGELTTISVEQVDPFGGGFQPGMQQPGRFTVPGQQQFQQPGFGVQQGQFKGGPVLVLDEERGYIVYYGTPAQQDKLQQLVEQFRPEDEHIVIREYRLEHGDAEQVGELLRAILLQEPQTGNGGGLLPGGTGAGTRSPTTGRNLASGRVPQPPAEPGAAAASGEASFTGRPDQVLIAADTANNQLLIRAPQRQQSELERIIAKIDVRRPQVYIDVQIVSLTNTNDFRLAVETQLINAGGSGGLLQSNFGLTSPVEGGGITDLRQVNPNLRGLTSALILSDQLPFVINAIQTVTDAKVVANPSLLVDNNETASIISVRQEPFQQSTITPGGSEVVSTEFAEAGTSLLVTPRISSGGYLRLAYTITLSSFSGTEGNPPPIDDRTVEADSVTIPSDATIVVGGISLDTIRDTVIKVPILGDIPLIGLAFRDTQKVQTGELLYVFITPRILGDKHFGGHRLITEGPRRIADIAPDIPPMNPVRIPYSPGSDRGG